MYSNSTPEIYRKRLVIEGKYSASIKGEKFVSDFLVALARELKMHIINGPFVSSATGKAKTIHEGYEGQVVWAESGANTYIWSKYNFCTVDIYSCKYFDTNKAIRFVNKYFVIKDFSYQELPDPLAFEEDKRVEVKDTGKKGMGMYAKKRIPKNTVLSYVDGQIFYAEKEGDFKRRKNESLFFARDHAIPFHKKLYRNSFNSQATKYNHCCEPNCYVKDLFFITTMRDIQPGEELTVSYSLFCNSDWKVPGGKCVCMSKQCLGTILPWRKLPTEYKLKYLDYTADWILFEEMKKNKSLDSLRAALTKNK